MADWEIGEVRISSVLEVVREVPAVDLIGRMSEANVACYKEWLQPNYLTADNQVRIAIRGILIESEGSRILVDPGFGNDRHLPYSNMPPLHTDFLERITARGFGRDDVDVVVCTHLHFDHVGWTTVLSSEAWEPTFPNARYVFVQDEYDYWQEHEDFNVDLTDSIDPVVRAGLNSFVSADYAITNEVRLVPSPGHTPGHTCIAIESGGKRALISGDMLHHPVQIVEQSWSAAPDHEPGRAIKTRRRRLEEVANAGVLLIGTHFAEPAAGFVTCVDGVWSWQPFTRETEQANM